MQNNQIIILALGDADALVMGGDGSSAEGEHDEPRPRSK